MKVCEFYIPRLRLLHIGMAVLSSFIYALFPKSLCFFSIIQSAYNVGNLCVNSLPDVANRVQFSHWHHHLSVNYLRWSVL